MQLKRLTKAQTAQRAEEVRPHLVDCAPESIRALLEHMGIWERIEGLLQPAPAADLTPEEQRRAVLAGLFAKACGGDASAARAFNELLEKQQSVSGPAAPAAVVVQVVPYEVPDKMDGREEGRP